MKKKSNKKGFTLVEIIGVIAILGIVSVVGLVSVNSIIQKGKEEHYAAAEQNLKLSAESYAQTNRDNLPKNVGEKKKVTLRTLVENNYIEQVKDYHDKNCDLDNSYVQIFKYSKNGYSYLVYLDCPEYKNTEQNNDLKPTIRITMTDNENNIKKTKSEVKITDSHKLLSYSITIYKYDEEVYTTGNIEANYNTEITKTVDISKYTPGKLKTVVTATNIYGHTETASLTKTYADKQKPTCIVKDEDKTRDNDDWIKTGNRKITVGCDDGEEGSGCEREEFTQTFKTDMKYGYITIKDKAGNTQECRVDVFIDRTKPSCTISDTGTKGLNSWYITNASMTLNDSDEMSGIKNRTLQTSATLGTYNQSTKATQTETKGQVWYGFVEDYAGNTANCVSNSVKVDTTAPTAPSGGTVQVSGTSADAEVGAVSGSTDATSGVWEYRYYVKNSSGTPANTNSNFTTSRAFKRKCGTSYYGYAIAVDNAGNISAVHYIGSDSDGANVYSSWGNCSVACGGGTQSRTNSCELVTTGLVQECNTQSCCSEVYYQDGASCTETCGGGTRNRLAYSIYNGQRCSSKDKTSGGSSCNTHSCCSDVYYRDGGSCSASCDAGTYNRLAYSDYTGERCPSYDKSSGGGYCNLGACYVEPEPEPEPEPELVYQQQCYAFINSKSGEVVKFTTTTHDACAVSSVKGGNCSISNKAAHSFKANFTGVNSCGFRVTIEGVYKWNGGEYNYISWTTKRNGSQFCTDSRCV